MLGDLSMEFILSVVEGVEMTKIVDAWLRQFFDPQFLSTKWSDKGWSLICDLTTRIFSTDYANSGRFDAGLIFG
jgi:hypothetical protein